jgi:hypothetical protein
VRWSKRRLVSFQRNSSRVVHSVDVVGPASELDEHWPQIEEHVASGVDLRDGGRELLEVPVTGFVGAVHVDVERGRLIRPRRVALGGRPAATAT